MIFSENNPVSIGSPWRSRTGRNGPSVSMRSLWCSRRVRIFAIFVAEKPKELSMIRTKAAIMIGILSLLLSCEKGKVKTESFAWHVHYQTSPIPITKILPDLEGENITSEGGCYSILIQLPDVNYSYNPGRIWLEPQDTTFTAIVEGFNSPSVFDTPAKVPFHSRDNLSFHGLHQGKDVESVGYGPVTGTLTLHISYPETLPFDKITLAANSSFNLPSFISLSSENSPGITADRHCIKITEDVEIPRNGYDFTLECTFLSVHSVSGDTSLPLSGRFESGGAILLSPDNLADSDNMGWTPSLEISLSTSIIEFTEVAATLDYPSDNEVVSVINPFPALSEEGLYDFNLAQIKAHVTTDNLSYYFSGKYFTQKGEDYRETKPWEFSPYSKNYFFSQALDGVEYIYFDVSDYSRYSLDGLNDLVKAPLPDSIGFSVQVTYFHTFFQPGRDYTINISNRIYIPLMFAGKNWGKTLQTDRITISAKEMEACPGTDFYITGWVMNRQPFELKAVPVIVDADGVNHRFEEDAIIVEGSRYYDSPNGKKEFTVIWTAEQTSRPIDVYLELTLGTSVHELLTPEQDIIFGISHLAKEKIIEK